MSGLIEIAYAVQDAYRNGESIEETVASVQRLIPRTQAVIIIAMWEAINAYADRQSEL